MENEIFLNRNLSETLIKEGEFELRQYILSSLLTTEDSIKEFQQLNKKIDRFILGHAERYKKKCKHNLELFTRKFATWLEQQFVYVKNKETFNDDEELSHAESLSKTKKRKHYEILRNQADPVTTELVLIDTIPNADRKINTKIVQKLDDASPSMKKRILQLLSNDSDESVPYTHDEALALMVDLRLGRYQYQAMRMGAKTRKSNIYPSYHKILEAKKKCYPSSITVSEIGAEINLQALLNHTSSRLIEICDLDVFANLTEIKLILIVKWGMDGASGQSLYKQIFPNKPGGTSDDSSVFMIAMVALQLKSATGIIWNNPVPSSTKFCRPIKFEFMKEKEITTIELYQKVRLQINKLLPFSIALNKKLTVHVTYEMELTMIDGKTVNYLSSNSSQQTCNICNAVPTEMNDIDQVRKKVCKTEYFHFGLSTLHCWIRFLECILHIAYKLSIQKWTARDKNHQLVVEATKRKIQTAYKTKKGLSLDFVRQGGGNSNDGNTARRFFEDVKFAAETTGVDESLIHRFKIILTTLCCGRNVDPIKFEKYSIETAKLYSNLYKWYYMPASVHRVLIHGAQCINSFNLPIGVYSEEAQEARNKEFKRIRLHSTRKTSRLATNEDLIHGLLVSSDPIITNLRIDKPKPHKELDSEVLDLLSE